MVWVVNGGIEKIELKHADSQILSQVLVDSLVGRFKYVLNNDIFLAATFLDFNFKCFTFVTNEADRTKYIKQAVNFIKDFYKKHKSKIDEMLSKTGKKSENASNGNSISPQSQIVCRANSTPVDSTPRTPKNSNQTEATPTSASTASPETIEIESSITDQAKVNNTIRPKQKFFKNLFDPKPTETTYELDSLDHELEQYKQHIFSVSETANEEINELGPMYFFKVFTKNYPILSCIAKAIFCITASSVPSECLFSIIGIIQNELRNRLGPDVLEDITIIKENKYN